MIDSDLDFLLAERPQPAELDEQTTALVRAALVERIGGARDGGLHLRRLVRIPALAAVAAAVAVAVALATSPGPAGSPTHHRAPAAARAPQNHARLPPLLQLADHVRGDLNPPGDATLVLRTQVYPHSPSITGADLYTDSGKYFYATTKAGLPAAIAGDDDQGGAEMQRELSAAIFAVDGPIDQARHRMATSALDPNAKPVDPATMTAAQRAIWNKLQERIRQIKQRTHYPPASPETLLNGNIWSNSLDVLLAGAGNPQVRAGVLRLLATIPQVTVAHSSHDGVPTLVLTAALFEPPGYREQLTINANTGIPIGFVGGVAGQTPSVTVSYVISRVTVASIAAGH
jgi:hypothetical protein